MCNKYRTGRQLLFQIKVSERLSYPWLCYAIVQYSITDYTIIALSVHNICQQHRLHTYKMLSILLHCHSIILKLTADIAQQKWQNINFLQCHAIPTEIAGVIGKILTFSLYHIGLYPFLQNIPDICQQLPKYKDDLSAYIFLSFHYLPIDLFHHSTDQCLKIIQLLNI